MKKKVTDQRFIQANREAIMAVVLSLAYFIWWYATAYGFGDKPFSKYTYIMGMPTWFFLSCVVGFILFAVLAAVMVFLFFKDIPLDGNVPEPPKVSGTGGDA